MNLVGLYYLTRREIHRFMKVINQSIFPPIVSSLIFIFIFNFVIGESKSIEGIGYLEFIVPGLVMMSIINNVFTNSAFSLFISKFTHHFSHLLTMPLSYFEMTTAYVIGSMVRGFLTSIGIFIAVAFFVKLSLHSLSITLLFFVISSVLFGSLGIIAALWAKQFDHLGIFNTFLLTPLTMLGGVFYSIKTLPPAFQQFTMFNPVFYLVDGFRYGLLGISDSSILFGAIITGTMAIASFMLTVYLMKKGWQVKQ